MISFLISSCSKNEENNPVIPPIYDPPVPTDSLYIDSLALSPLYIEMKIFQDTLFNISVWGSDSFHPLKWESKLGKIYTTGYYKAPAFPGIDTIKVTSIEDTTKSEYAVILITSAPLITFASTRAGYDFEYCGGDCEEIYVMHLDGSGVTQLTSTPQQDLEPVWSPDGSQIAYYHGGKINIMNFDGSNQRTITNAFDGFAASPCWSPDGTKLAFWSTKSGDPQVWVIDSDGGNPYQVTQEPPSMYAKPPRWSPDGSKIVFPSYREFNHDISTINPDGTGLMRLTDHPAVDVSPTWSPDGSKIMFTSDRDGKDKLYTMNPDGTNVEILTSSNVVTIRPRYSPDGTKIIATTSFNNKSKIHIMNLDGSDIKIISFSDYHDFYPDWQP